MAAYIYPQKPGSKFGPCEESCEHTECWSMRADAAQPCPICGQAIGYDRYVYIEKNTDGVKILVHAKCSHLELIGRVERA